VSKVGGRKTKESAVFD